MKTENNKIIAEFLGYKSETKGDYLIFEIPSNDGKNYKVIDKDLEFHKNWNWLMEVVEKIESVEGHLHICDNDIFLHFPKRCIDCIRIDGERLNLNKKEAVYKSCLEFIKWYNENLAKQKETVK